MTGRCSWKHSYSEEMIDNAMSVTLSASAILITILQMSLKYAKDDTKQQTMDFLGGILGFNLHFLTKQNK